MDWSSNDTVADNTVTENGYVGITFANADGIVTQEGSHTVLLFSNNACANAVDGIIVNFSTSISCHQFIPI